MTDSLPEYQPRLEAFHKAFEGELRAIVHSLPISPRMQVLDVGCGDGFYSRLLAERLESPGSITGLDTSAAYLSLAEHAMAESPSSAEVEFIQAKLEDLPTRGRRWDVVWCAQSLYSLPEPVSALAQMAELVRPGGFVIVLENDSMHEVLLPWPPDIEITLRSAELAKFRQGPEDTFKYYVGRRLPSVFAQAGLEPLFFRTQCIDRQAPLDPDLRAFLELYLQELLESAKEQTNRELAKKLEAHIDPRSEQSVLRQPQFTMSWLNVLAWGRRPTGVGLEKVVPTVP